MTDDRADLSADILARLHHLHPKLIDLSLDRMKRLLAALGNPEQNLPPIIHVAGTNGKGSTVAYLDAILRYADRRVDSYISPHLVRFNERIRLDGTPIDDDNLAGFLHECEEANDGEQITFFEITTAAAFLAFSRSGADYLLLEVGLGGRLDATNVVERPVLSAITPVSIDHTQYLGDSLTGIAAEKAGILKPGVPAIIGKQEAEAEHVIATLATEMGTPLLRQGREWQVHTAGNGLRYEGLSGAYDFPLPALAGDHQIGNAGIAIASIEALNGSLFDWAAISHGLTTVCWPGRLQRVARSPLPEGWELWLDGGHNEAAGQAVAAAREWRDQPLYLVVGMLNTKPPVEFLRPFAPLATNLTAVPVPESDAGLDTCKICEAGESLGLITDVAADTSAALDRLACEALPGRVLVCGSLYLVGYVLSELES